MIFIYFLIIFKIAYKIEIYRFRHAWLDIFQCSISGYLETQCTVSADDSMLALYTCLLSFCLSLLVIIITTHDEVAGSMMQKCLFFFVFVKLHCILMFSLVFHAVLFHSSGQVN